VRNDAGIAALEDLKGKRLAVPVGSTAHFSLMGALTHAGIAEGDVTIMNMPPDQIAAAWEQGAIDAAFIWQPVQSQILQTGTLLVGADKTAEWGYPTFDGWVVNTEFAAENADAVAAFAKTMDAANAAYLTDPAAWTADSAQVKTIAEATVVLVRTAAVDPSGRLWVSLVEPYTYVYDREGHKIRTVQFKAAGTARYTWPAGPGRAHVQGTITYRDSAPVDLRQDMDGSGTNPNDFLGRLGSATLVDLFAGFDWSRYSAELFVSNLFDERDEVARFVACSVCTQTRVLPGRPRTFGIRLGAHF